MDFDKGGRNAMAVTSLFCEPQSPLQAAAMPSPFQTFPALKEAFCAGFGKSLLPQRLSCAGAPALPAQRTQGWLCRVFAGWFAEMQLACDSFPNLWNNNDSSVWRGLVLLFWRESFHLLEELREGAFGRRYLLQQQPAKDREYTWTWGIKANWQLENMTISKSPSDVALEDNWWATQNALPRTCSSTVCLESHTKSCQPVPNPLQPCPKGAWGAPAAGLGWHTNPYCSSPWSWPAPS